MPVSVVSYLKRVAAFELKKKKRINMLPATMNLMLKSVKVSFIYFTPPAPTEATLLRMPCTTFSLSIPLSVNTGFSHVLAIVNNSLVTSWCRYFFEMMISSSLAIYPRVGWLDHLVVLFLTS